MGETPRVWRARDIEWTIDRTLVMGVLNVTPDSFSDGGKFLDPRAAVERAGRIAEEGADVLDIGGGATAAGGRPVNSNKKGDPATVQENPRYEDVVGEVKAFLAERLRDAVSHGVSMESIVVDPGLGFGKTPDHNTTLLHALREISAIGRPVLVGTSRKSFLESVHSSAGGRRLEASLAAAAVGVQNGADVVRVHDVAEAVQFMRQLATSTRTQQ